MAIVPTHLSLKAESITLSAPTHDVAAKTNQGGRDMESNEMSKALETARDCWPQPFKRSPVEDGRNMAMLPLKLGKHFINGVDQEVSAVSEELAKAGFTLDGE